MHYHHHHLHQVPCHLLLLILLLLWLLLMNWGTDPLPIGSPIHPTSPSSLQLLLLLLLFMVLLINCRMHHPPALLQLMRHLGQVWVG